jgi:hypothetical protein
MAASPTASRALRLCLAGACALASIAVLWAHVIAARPRPLWQFEYRRWVDDQMYSTASWRYWDDMRFAIGRYLERRYGPAPARRGLDGRPLPPMPNSEMTSRYTEALWNQTDRRRIQPYEFWRTVPDRPFVRRRQAYVLPFSEDPGRGLIASVAFEVLGGISPYVAIWLAPLLFIPCALWCFYEWVRAGRTLGGCVFLGLLAFSGYVAETLTHPHSAVGFYFNALIVALALALYAAGPSRSRAGYFVRAAATGIALALCALCRSGSLLIAPAYALCLLIAARRIWGSQGWWPARRAWLPCAAACLLLSVPYLVVRPNENHAIWQGGFWAGLGDYGRDRGYSWHDRDGKRFLMSQGVRPFAHPNEVTPEQEAVYRRAVLRDITGHPVWYARILAKRLVATVTQSKLLPWRPLSGRSVSEPIFHYKYVTPIDYFGWPLRYAELPLPLFWLTVPLLLALHLLRRTQDRLRQDAQVLLLFALAPLVLPVLISTAAGIETQAFALVYLIAFALLVDAAWRSLRARPA